MTKRRTLTRSWVATTEADYRAWGKAVSDSIVAVGMKRTGTALNWDTVARPGAANSFGVFEDYEFGGALQATYPIRVRVGYGWAGSTVNNGVNSVQVFAGTQNGRTPGYVCGWSSTGTNATSTSSAASYFASDGENWLTLWFGADLQSNGNGIVTVERYRDENGAYAGYGCYTTFGGTTKGAALITTSGSEHPIILPPTILPVNNVGSTNLSSVKAGRVGLYPHILDNPGHPPQSIYTAFVGDYADREEVTLPDGRAYLACPSAAHEVVSTWSTSSTNNTNKAGRLLVRTDGARV